MNFDKFFKLFDQVVKTRFELEFEDLFEIVDKLYFYKPRAVLAEEDKGQFLAISAYDIHEKLMAAAKGEIPLRISDNPRSEEHFDEVTAIEVVNYDFDPRFTDVLSMRESMMLTFADALTLSQELSSCGIPNWVVFKGRGCSLHVFVKYELSSEKREQLFEETLNKIIQEKLKQRGGELRRGDLYKSLVKTRDIVREVVNYALQLIYVHLYATFLGRGVIETCKIIPRVDIPRTLDLQACRVKEFTRCLFVKHQGTGNQVLVIYNGEIITPEEVVKLRNKLRAQAIKVSELFGFEPDVTYLEAKLGDLVRSLGLEELRPITEQDVLLMEQVYRSSVDKRFYSKKWVTRLEEIPLPDMREQVANLIFIPYLVCVEYREICLPGVENVEKERVEQCIEVVWNRIAQWLAKCGVDPRKYRSSVRAHIKWFRKKPNACIDTEYAKSLFRRYCNIRRLFKLKLLEIPEDLKKSLGLSDTPSVIEYLAAVDNYFKQLYERYRGRFSKY